MSKKKREPNTIKINLDNINIRKILSDKRTDALYIQPSRRRMIIIEAKSRSRRKAIQQLRNTLKNIIDVLKVKRRHLEEHGMNFRRLLGELEEY